MKIFVTGCAGFVGMHTCIRLVKEGHDVFGVDSINDYYDPILKQSRLEMLQKLPNFKFARMDIVDEYEWMDYIFHQEKFDRVIHLAAQAGVRYSMENPHAYIDSNVKGFINILELCKNHTIGHLIYASSSSVYGNSKDQPYKETQDVNEPISIYATTKRSNELMAYSYSHLYNLPTTGLRFFTVYGPWGRPDMAPFLFADAIVNGRELKMYNSGELYRDFTYVDDIVEGIVGVADRLGLSGSTYEIYNIGNGSPVHLKKFIECIEKELAMTANKKDYPMQSGDVFSTHADTTKLENAIGFKPKTELQTGIKNFIKWFVDYYQH